MTETVLRNDTRSQSRIHTEAADFFDDDDDSLGPWNKRQARSPKRVLNDVMALQGNRLMARRMDGDKRFFGLG
jgi:hypothetical protein